MAEQDPSPGAPSFTRWRINIVAVTWMSYAGFYFCRKAFGIVKPVLKEEHGFTNLDLAHIWTVYLVAYMFGQFLSARLGRSVSCRHLLLTGMLISVLCNVGLGFSSTAGQAAFWPMIGLMIVNGFAQATGWPGNVGLLAKWSRRSERGRLMAIWATCYQIGSILAKHFAAFMLAWLGMQWSFWGASIVLFGVWTLFYFIGKDRPEDVGLPPLTEEITVEVDEGTRTAPAEQPFSKVIRIIVAMGLIYFCFKFLRYALDSWAPLLIAETFNEKADVAGHMSTIFDWVGFTGVIFGGFVSDKLFGSKRTPVIFFMSIGMCMACAAWWWFGTSSQFAFVAIIGVIGFMLMGPDSLLSGTAAMDVSSKEMAVVASGIINGLGSIGPIIQEQLIGYFMDSKGVDAVFMILFTVSVLAVLGTGALYASSRRAGSAL